MRWLLVNHIDLLIPNDKISGGVSFDPDAPFFRDHFPGFPVVPGVILLESLAQLAGKLIGYSVRVERGDWPFPILSMMEGVKFRRFVRPGEQVILESRIIALRDEMCHVKSKAKVGKQMVAQAEQIFVFNAVPLSEPGEKERLEALEHSYLRQLWPHCPETVELK